jgi:hypothetical protein
VVEWWILGVERLDLYEWNSGQGLLQNSLLRNEIRGKYVLQRFVIEVVLECLCPAKIHPANGFSEKKIGQVCPAKIRFGRFDSEGTRGTVRFCDCRLKNIKMG